MKSIKSALNRLEGANEPELNLYDDGYLIALELAKLDLKGTELVVISGCESGLGDIRLGESVYGLKRSITVVGARSSLLSFWKLSDNGTALFMESFYKKLSQSKSKAVAFVEI